MVNAYTQTKGLVSDWLMCIWYVRVWLQDILSWVGAMTRCMIELGIRRWIGERERLIGEKTCFTRRKAINDRKIHRNYGRIRVFVVRQAVCVWVARAINASLKYWSITHSWELRHSITTLLLLLLSGSFVRVPEVYQRCRRKETDPVCDSRLPDVWKSRYRYF